VQRYVLSFTAREIGAKITSIFFSFAHLLVSLRLLYAIFLFCYHNVDAAVTEDGYCVTTAS
jgi:hypothetical protein